MTSGALRPGLTGEVSLVVAPEHTAQHLGSGGVEVLATPQMILLMERASVAAIDHLLPEGLQSVGVHLDVRHLAPTPIGFEVRASAEVIQVRGREVTFRVDVHEQPFDQDSLVGTGTHQRVIVHAQRFGERVAQKLANSKDP